MKTIFGGSLNSQYHPKMRMKRIRTCSSDSGCDMVCDSPDLTYAIMEDAVMTWEMRLEGVMKQEVARCREVTGWAKEALRHAGEDQEKRGDVMESWRCQLQGIMDFTKDLIECVNNDTKELMYNCSSVYESSTVIEELAEDDTEGQEEEIMQLFLLSAIEGNKNLTKRSKHSNNKEKGLMKEFMSIYKRNGKMFRHSRKSNKEVQTAYAKIKRHDSISKRRLSWEETKFQEEFGHNAEDFNYSEKMFQSVIDWLEIFSDWSWNLAESQDGLLEIFAEWRWNFEETEDLKKVFYDDPGVETEWNEFNFWKVSDNILLDLDTGCLADCETDDKSWEECQYWQNTNDNFNIIHCLVDGEEEEEKEEEEEYHNYWDESAANQSIIDSLLDDKDHSISEVDEEFIWESKQPLIALIDFGTEDEKTESDEGVFLWNDREIAMSLLDSEDDREDEDLILWDNPLYINTLLHDEEDDDLIQFPDDEDNNWTEWAFWNKFGPISEIVEAYESCVEQQPGEIPTINIQEVFWGICLEDSKRGECWQARDNLAKNKDPVNIFKSIRHIFNVPNDKKKKKIDSQRAVSHLLDDMEDIYADWINFALCDDRTEKKRSNRGQKKSKKKIDNRTITTKAKLPIQHNFESNYIETKVPIKEKKTAFAKNQKRLHAKMFAKQPRKV